MHVAAPKMLGLLRQAIPTPVQSMLAGEIPKDLMNHGPDAILNVIPRDAFFELSAGTQRFAWRADGLTVAAEKAPRCPRGCGAPGVASPRAWRSISALISAPRITT
jgi:hypothetical protein